MSDEPKTLAERAAAGAKNLSEGERTRHAADEAAERERRVWRDGLLDAACTPPRHGLRGLLHKPASEAEAERAWLRGLPFRVVQYEELFQPFFIETSWAIRMRFVDAQPPDQLLLDLFGNVSSAASLSRKGSIVLPDRDHDRYVDLNLPDDVQKQWASDPELPDRMWRLRLLFHRAVDEVLRPLHAEYPLVEVEPRHDHTFPSDR